MNSHSKSKGLHSNNKHSQGYDFEKMCATSSTLKDFVFTNKYGTETIDFANPKAVKALNFALLKNYYGIDYWEFSDENLCPPIPGRVDYIHHLHDLLQSSGIEKNITVLDIGTGATCIYPLLGVKEYNWKFVGSDIDIDSLKNSQEIINQNSLSESIELIHQENAADILSPHLFKKQFAASMCNPPFYASQYEAVESNARKLKGLGIETTKRNFGGSQNELWYKGGEKAFLHNYLYQSSLFKSNCFWYTSLVSKKENIESMITSLTKLGASEIKNIPMHQGNKVTRIIAWTFLSKSEQKDWIANQ